MSWLRPRKRAAILLLCGSLIALLAAGTVLPVAFRRHQVCLRCGRHLQLRDFFGLFSITWSDGPTRLTDWYGARVGTPHEHEWIWTGCGAMLNLWQMPMGYACGSVEPMASNPNAFGELLERLRPLELDVQAHEALTQADEEARCRIQRSALEALDGGEEDLRAWYASTQVGPRVPGPTND